jgi:hypothetical protein
VLVPRFVSGWLWLVGNFDELPVILLEGSVQFAALSGNGVPNSAHSSAEKRDSVGAPPPA